MDEEKPGHAIAQPFHSGCHLYLARRTALGVRLTSAHATCVVIADNRLPASDLERSGVLARLVALKTPLVLVAEGRIRPLSAVDGRHGQRTPLAGATCCSAAASRRRAGAALSAPGPQAELERAGPRIRRAIAFMLDHYQDGVSLKDLAREACLSPCYFCRLFKVRMGMTCMSYMSRLRVQEAARLLLQSDLSITKICYQVGFNDLTHFERVFKSQFLLTPTSFRRSTPPLGPPPS